jgi:hypothetical protein
MRTGVAKAMTEGEYAFGTPELVNAHILLTPSELLRCK